MFNLIRWTAIYCADGMLFVLACAIPVAITYLLITDYRSSESKPCGCSYIYLGNGHRYVYFCEDHLRVPEEYVKRLRHRR
jgi:hypothetical protein